jgi:hypothetical protein
MRKITVSTMVSLDGVMGDPQTWAMEHFDETAQVDGLKRLLISDGMLLGRTTYQALAQAWNGRSGPFADRINTIPKVVFSSTLERADWGNAVFVRGDIVAEAEGGGRTRPRDLRTRPADQDPSSRGPDRRDPASRHARSGRARRAPVHRDRSTPADARPVDRPAQRRGDPRLRARPGLSANPSACGGRLWRRAPPHRRRPAINKGNP